MRFNKFSGFLLCFNCPYHYVYKSEAILKANKRELVIVKAHFPIRVDMSCLNAGQPWWTYRRTDKLTHGMVTFSQSSAQRIPRVYLSL